MTEAITATPALLGHRGSNATAAALGPYPGIQSTTGRRARRAEVSAKATAMETAAAVAAEVKSVVAVAILGLHPCQPQAKR